MPELNREEWLAKSAEIELIKLDATADALVEIVAGECPAPPFPTFEWTNGVDRIVKVMNVGDEIGLHVENLEGDEIVTGLDCSVCDDVVAALEAAKEWVEEYS